MNDILHERVDSSSSNYHAVSTSTCSFNDGVSRTAHQTYTSKCASTEERDLDLATNAVHFAYLGYKLQSDNLLLKMFTVSGSCCLKCSVKTEPSFMVLCRCGCLMCLNCCLTKECFCSFENPAAANMAVHRDCEQEASGKRVFNAGDYFTAFMPSIREISLDGKEFQLECRFYSPT